MRQVLALLVVAATLPACALLRTAEGQLADHAAAYCRAAPDKRQALADYLNATLKPNSLTMTCAADGAKP